MPSSPISPCPSCPPHAAGGHGCAVYSSSVTDAEWAILEPLLPAPGSTAGRGGRPEKHCRRVIVDAILYIVRGGIAWRQLPVEFPPAGTVYAVFARWARSGAWQRILDALRDRLRVRAGRDRCPTAAIIDSQTVPAADTVPRSSRGWDGGKRTNGVKRHIAVDVNGLLLAVVVTAASIQDRDAAHRLLAALRGSQVIGVDRVYCATPFNETWESVIGTLMMHAIAEAQSSSSEVSMTKRSALVVSQSDVQQVSGEVSRPAPVAHRGA